MQYYHRRPPIHITHLQSIGILAERGKIRMFLPKSYDAFEQVKVI
uniref:ADP-ribosylation factor-like protein 2 isoform X1 n=1 Tax=Rhizophora mucronata TaxID=61149 RepID=A0A2P2IV23_RHIMU